MGTVYLPVAVEGTRQLSVVGRFEQRFGLARSPANPDMWCIRAVQMHLGCEAGGAAAAGGGDQQLVSYR